MKAIDADLRIAHEKEKHARYYASHRDETQARCHAYYMSHKKEHQARCKVWNDAHREERIVYHRKYNIIHREELRERKLVKAYGISLLQYNALLDSQGGACAICKRMDWNGRGPHVDHDHTTGKIRGIVCSSCNTGLGYIRDNPGIARAMADYLEEKK